MKEMMKRAFAFISFEQLVTKSQIASRFLDLRNVYQHEIDTLELISIRHELIYEYWYNHVIKHFCSLFLILIIIPSFLINKLSVPVVGIVGLIFFSGFYFFYYRFVFRFIFIPKLDLIKEEFERNRYEETKKCRKAQYSNFTLVLIDYAITEISKMDALAIDDKTASMLTELYGVDTGSLKKSLELLFMKNKRKQFTERKKTEFKNRFNEAYDFFEKRRCLEGIKKIREVETTFFG